MSGRDFGRRFPALPDGFGPCDLQPILREEDGTPYKDVCLVTAGDRRYILKAAKGAELSVYRRFLSAAPSYAPRLLMVIPHGEREYLLLEHIDGTNLQKCTRPALTLALDALIEMQKAHWNGDTADGDFADNLPGRRGRRAYLGDSLLETQYDAFLRLYAAQPRTLCHDDLLPFNVIAAKDRAVMIDWEHAGILPYPVSLARLIAHVTADPDGLFFMTEEDRDFAVRYYFELLAKPMGIPWEVFRRDLDYSLLYEYCEWVFLGYKYDQRDTEIFKRYEKRAAEHAKMLSDTYRGSDFV